MEEEVKVLTTDNSEQQRVVGVPFTKDDPRINREGRPPETPEQKVIKKATKEFIQEFTEKLAEALPEISPVLIKKAIEGDIQAIKEVNDRVMGRPKVSVEHSGEIRTGLTPEQQAKWDTLLAKKEKPEEAKENDNGNSKQGDNATVAKDNPTGEGLRVQ